jgi:hypothetical protein
MDRLEAMSIVLAVVEEGSLGEVLPSTVSAEKTPLLRLGRRPRTGLAVRLVPGSCTYAEVCATLRTVQW